MLSYGYMQETEQNTALGIPQKESFLAQDFTAANPAVNEVYEDNGFEVFADLGESQGPAEFRDSKKTVSALSAFRKVTSSVSSTSGKATKTSLDSGDTLDNAKGELQILTAKGQNTYELQQQIQSAEVAKRLSDYRFNPEGRKAAQNTHNREPHHLRGRPMNLQA